MSAESLRAKSLRSPSHPYDGLHVSAMRSRCLSSVLVLVLWITAIPVAGQTPSADSVTFSAESIQALQEATAALNQELEAARNAQPTEPDVQNGPYGGRTAIAKVLFLFLVLSLVFESAMSAIFDWRVFIRYFEGRGVKTPLLVAIAFLMCVQYDLDIVHDLLVALGETGTGATTAGQFFTALLIAGGSGGIFRIFSRLGIRSPEERDQRAREIRAQSSQSTNEDE